MPLNLIPRIKEGLEGLKGYKKYPSMTKEKAEEILRSYSESIEQNKETALLEVAKKAADRFVKNDLDNSFAKKLIARAQKLLDEKQKEEKNKISALNLSAPELTALTKALANDAETDKAIEVYQEAAKKLALPKDKNDLIKLKQALEKQIGDQHKAEIKNLQALFADGGELVANSSAEAYKEHMLDALKKSHTEQLKSLDSDVDPSKDDLREFSQRERAKILFLSLIAQNLRNEENVAGIINKETGELTVSTDDSFDSKKYANADLKSLKDFYTLSGKSINIEDNNFIISSSVIGFGISDNDALQLALFAKASGWETIRMSVEHTGTDGEAFKLAQIAARACLKAGFDPLKITIRIKEGNDYVTKTLDELNVFPAQNKSLVDAEPDSPSTAATFKARNLEQKTAPEETPPVTPITASAGNKIT